MQAKGLYIRNVCSLQEPLDQLDNECIQAFSQHGFAINVTVSTDHDIQEALSYDIDTILFRTDGLSLSNILHFLPLMRRKYSQLFLCILSKELCNSPYGRYECFEYGASMVTNNFQEIHQVMECIVRSIHHLSANRKANRRLYTCPYCHRDGFTEDDLWTHVPLYHINSSNNHSKQMTENYMICPICKESPRGPYQVHLHNAHGPPGRGELPSEFRTQDTTLYCFALVVCYNKQLNKYLLVQEFARSGYWLPGGRVDAGENPMEAAIRETKEEAGIQVRLTGIIKVEYHPKNTSHRSRNTQSSQYVRMRVIFAAEPIDWQEKPKSIPDYESVGATWCTSDEVQQLPLRGSEPIQYFSYLADGKPIYPLDILQVSSIDN